jgi:hypothetical protein
MFPVSTQPLLSTPVPAAAAASAAAAVVVPAAVLKLGAYLRRHSTAAGQRSQHHAHAGPDFFQLMVQQIQNDTQ